MKVRSLDFRLLNKFSKIIILSLMLCSCLGPTYIDLEYSPEIEKEIKSLSVLIVRPEKDVDFNKVKGDHIFVPAGDVLISIYSIEDIGRDESPDFLSGDASEQLSAMFADFDLVEYVKSQVALDFGGGNWFQVREVGVVSEPIQFREISKFLSHSEYADTLVIFPRVYFFPGLEGFNVKLDTYVFSKNPVLEKYKLDSINNAGEIYGHMEISFVEIEGDTKSYTGNANIWLGYGKERLLGQVKQEIDSLISNLSKHYSEPFWVYDKGKS